MIYIENFSNNQKGVILATSMLILFILTSLVLFSYELNTEEFKITGAYSQSARSFIISESVNSQIRNIGFQGDGNDILTNLFGNCSPTSINRADNFANLRSSAISGADDFCFLFIECTAEGRDCDSGSGLTASINGREYDDAEQYEQDILDEIVDVINISTTSRSQSGGIEQPNYNMRRSAFEVTIEDIQPCTTISRVCLSDASNAATRTCQYLLNIRSQSQIKSGIATTINRGIAYSTKCPN